eukprot:5838268-Ditylum_brightwellii.AAC.1
MSILCFRNTAKVRYANNSRQPSQYNTYRTFGNRNQNITDFFISLFAINSVTPTASQSFLQAYLCTYNKNLFIFTTKSRTTYHQVNLTLAG